MIRFSKVSVMDNKVLIALACYASLSVTPLYGGSQLIGPPSSVRAFASGFSPRLQVARVRAELVLLPPWRSSRLSASLTAYRNSSSTPVRRFGTKPSGGKPVTAQSGTDHRAIFGDLIGFSSDGLRADHALDNHREDCTLRSAFNDTHLFVPVRTKSGYRLSADAGLRHASVRPGRNDADLRVLGRRDSSGHSDRNGGVAERAILERSFRGYAAQQFLGDAVAQDRGHVDRLSCVEPGATQLHLEAARYLDESWRGEGHASASRSVAGSRRQLRGVCDYRAGERLVEFCGSLLENHCARERGVSPMNQNALTYPLQRYQSYAYNEGLYPSLGTLQQMVQDQGPTGNPTGNWQNVAGVVNIPCGDAPPSVARVQATEMKDVAEIMAKGLRHVLLNQCFLDAPNWAGQQSRFTVDGITYEVLGAENDSQLTQTRLDLQLVTL